MKKHQLKRLKKRIKRQNVDRWRLLEKFNWRCQKCGKEYLSKSALIVNLDEKTVYCKVCSYQENGYRTSVKRTETKEEIVRKAKEYGNMSKVAREVGISRERVRQIVTQSLIREGRRRENNDSNEDKPSMEDLKKLAQKNIKKYRKKARSKKVIKKINATKKAGVIPDYFTSKAKFASTVGVSAKDLELYAPELINKIRENTTYGHGGKKWSRFYLKCRVCGTTKTSHRSHGFCEDCYVKSDHFKELQEASRLRNKHRWKERARKYSKEIAKRKKRGGIKDKVFQRDKNRCSDCFVTREDHFRKYNEDLRLVNVGDSKEHLLKNYSTKCKDCFFKYLSFKRSKNKKQSR